MLTFLSRWLRPGLKVDARHLNITVYTRAQCGCCHKVINLLESYRRRCKFNLREIDIDSDPALVALYDTTVPVVAVAGKVRFKGQVNPVLFERLLVAECGGR
jgi:glutaredoxin